MRDPLLTSNMEMWKNNYPEEFLEAVGEYNQGSGAEAYWLIKNGLARLDFYADHFDRSELFGELFTQYEGTPS
jgi:hypothetical protein